MSHEFVDVTGTPRPLRDIEDALRFVEAEMAANPVRMGARDTGPAVIHLYTIRDVLLEVMKIRGAGDGT